MPPEKSNPTATAYDIEAVFLDQWLELKAAGFAVLPREPDLDMLRAGNDWGGHWTGNERQDLEEVRGMYLRIVAEFDRKIARGSHVEKSGSEKSKD